MPKSSSSNSSIKLQQCVTFGTFYLAYVMIYFARKPFSVIKFSISQQLGFSLQELGIIDTAFTASYAAALFSAGSLSNRFGPLKMLLFAYLGCALMTFSFGYSSSLLALGVTWTLNGFFQAGVFPWIVKVMTGWFPASTRGRVFGAWTTSQQIGGVLSTICAGYMLKAYDSWRVVLIYPAPVIGCMGMVLYAVVSENRIEEKGKGKGMGMGPSLSAVIKIKHLLNLGFCYFCLRGVRYAMMNWLPFYLKTQHNIDEDQAAYLSTIFDAAGILGSLTAGIVCDRLGSGRRAMVVLPMCIMTGLSVLLYSQIAGYGLVANGIGMGLIGFFVAGPDSVLGAAATADVCSRANMNDAISTAGGIVNGLGSVGTMIQGVVLAAIIQHYSWNAMFVTLSCISVAGAAVLIPICRYEIANKLD